MFFVNGYLAVMALESEMIKQLILAHLQESIEDGEEYGWSVVLSCHAVWLQYLQQGHAMCRDHVTKLKLRHALVWHRVAPSTKAPSASSQPLRQPSAGNRSQKKIGPYSEPAKPRSKACAAFNKGQCVDNTWHPADLHVCSYSLHNVQRLCHHTEQYCKCKTFSKNGVGRL